jgi:hypothetical protein
VVVLVAARLVSTVRRARTAPASLPSLT